MTVFEDARQTNERKKMFVAAVKMFKHLTKAEQTVDRLEKAIYEPAHETLVLLLRKLIP